MFKKIDESQWMDWEDFKKALNGTLKPAPVKVLKPSSVRVLNTCNIKSKKKGIGFGKKSS